MVLDHERCGVDGCVQHLGRAKSTDDSRRDSQIKEDWDSGEWTLDDLSSFWGLAPRKISMIIRREARRSRAPQKSPA